jgi:nicotinate-nucleotide pyrophosphorylase (carboxylating)
LINLNKLEIDRIIKNALDEDLNKLGDITSEAVIPDSFFAKGAIKSNSRGVVVGMEIAARVFSILNESIIFIPEVSDGDFIEEGRRIALIEGSIKTILAGERTALNFLQHLSGIATYTHKFVRKVKPYTVKILDTRKTIPGLRILEKYAVKVGGGYNHRMGLYDAVLIKDNHIKSVGGTKKAVELVRLSVSEGIKIEVEAENLFEVKEALDAKADVIMLDNMSVLEMEEAVRLIDGKAQIEASGGINLDNVEIVAKTGVDFISVGAITLGAFPLDMSLEIIS